MGKSAGGTVAAHNVLVMLILQVCLDSTGREQAHTRDFLRPAGPSTASRRLVIGTLVGI